jgi:hypothetical protein
MIENKANVIDLTDQIVENGEKSVPELEKKRAIMLRAFALTAGQLEHDALKLEEGAIVGNYEIKRRHEMMTTAKSLREAVGWLQALVTPVEGDANAT